MLLRHCLAATTSTLLAANAVAGTCCVVMPAKSLAMVAPHAHLAANPAKLPAIMAGAMGDALTLASHVQSHARGVAHTRYAVLLILG